MALNLRLEEYFPLEVNETVLLRPFTSEDCPEFYSMVVENREHLGVWLPWASKVYKLDDAKEYLMRGINATSSGEAVQLGIIEKEKITRKLIGLISIRKIGVREPEGFYYGEIGYFLSASEQGRGIMTQSVRQLMAYGTAIGIKQFVMNITEGNNRSIAIAERLNYKCIPEAVTMLKLTPDTEPIAVTPYEYNV